MKDLINAAILIATIYGGTIAAREIHDTVKKAALEKVNKGMPSLTGLTAALRGEGLKKHKNK